MSIFVKRLIFQKHHETYIKITKIKIPLSDLFRIKGNILGRVIREKSSFTCLKCPKNANRGLF